MKRFLFLLAACTPEFSAELRPESTPPFDAMVEPDVSLYEGTAIYARVGIRENDSLRTDVDEEDIGLRIADPSIARVFPGPTPMSIVIFGLAAGETRLEISFKGTVVEDKGVVITAQAK